MKKKRLFGSQFWSLKDMVPVSALVKTPGQMAS
jgi:hypothetical protein